MLALATLNVDLSTYGSVALLALLALGGLVFFLGSLVLGRTPVSYDGSLPRKRMWQRFVNKVRHVVRLRPTGRKDRRSSMRREGEPVKVFVAPGTDSAEAGEGLVVDRSQGGLCLMVNEPVEQGSLLRVRAAHVPDDAQWVPVYVKRCQAQGDSWKLGCQFAENLPWSVNLLFG
jgi:PilZ domain